MSELQLESTTYHYAVKAPDTGWPDLKRQHGSVVYRPDHVSFDVHVTHEQNKVIVQNIRASGPRVLKHDRLGDRHGDNFYAYDFHRGTLPGFIEDAVREALSRHDG